MSQKLRRIPAVTNTFSGALGETRAVAELIRCGMKVAKPYWNDDEMDLLVFIDVGQRIVPLPVQVKSRQFLRSEEKIFIPIKKKYITGNPGLCLILYYPKGDEFWVIHGSANIIKAYDAQAAWNSKHTMFTHIVEDGDVRLAFLKSNDAFDKDWKVDKQDASDISQRLASTAKDIRQNCDAVKGLEAFWTF